MAATNRAAVPALMRMASHPLRWAVLTELAPQLDTFSIVDLLLVTEIEMLGSPSGTQ